MNRKMLGTLIMAATMAIGGIGVANISTNKSNPKNEVLLSRSNTSKTNEAVVINGDNNLILKATPRKNGKCISYISVGEMLTIEGTSGNYYKVKVHETNAVGYISMSNAQIIDNDEGQTLQSQNGSGVVINVSSTLNLRVGAGINSSILSELTEGTTFNIIGKQGQWYKVNVNGQVGFIYEEYVGFASNVVSNQNSSSNLGNEVGNDIPVISSGSGNNSNNNIINSGLNNSTTSNNMPTVSTGNSGNQVKTIPLVNKPNNEIPQVMQPASGTTGAPSSSQIGGNISSGTSSSNQTSGNISNSSSSSESSSQVSGNSPSTGTPAPAAKPEVTKPTSGTTGTPAPATKPEVTKPTSGTTGTPAPAAKPEVTKPTSGTTGTPAPAAKPEVTKPTSGTTGTPAPAAKPEVTKPTSGTTGTPAPAAKPEVTKPTSGTTGTPAPAAKPEVTKPTSGTTGTPAPATKPEVTKPTSGTTGTPAPAAKPEVTKPTSGTTGTPAPAAKPEVTKPTSGTTGTPAPATKPEVTKPTSGTTGTPAPAAKPEVTKPTSGTTGTPAPATKPEVTKPTSGTTGTPAPATKPAVVPQKPLTIYHGIVQTTNKTINVRTAPSTLASYSSVVGTLANGVSVNIISVDNGWYEIEFGGSIGYVNANNVNVKGANIPTSTSIANKSNTVKQNVNYPTTMKKYVAGELKEYNASYGGSLTKAQLETATKKIATAVNPKAAATVFEFLKVNSYRNINVTELNEALEGQGIFQGQGQAFINAAKEYNLDPIYLLSQAGLETGWGTSNFAKGTTITEVANLKDPIKNSKGELIGYKMIKLAKPVTVYNLFGVGAYNNTAAFSNKATITAEAAAYNNGWTSVPAAIVGAAQFLSTHYVHNTTIAQNTPYELRYIDGPDGDMWHQYSSDINYGQAIGEIMQQYSYLYSPNDTFTFGIPTFQNN